MLGQLLRRRLPKLLFSRCYSTANDCVILTEFNSCGIITLNRPKVLNSLNLEMIRLIYPKLKKWNENYEISHIIIEGVGSKAFCAGGDVRSVVDAVKKKDLLSESFFREEYQLNHLIGTLTKPYIALLDGITMGGGVGLSVHGRHRIATENTLFAMPETALGLFPDVGGGYFLPRLAVDGLGGYLALTGHRLIGREVFWSGVATHFISSTEIPKLKEDLCHLNFPSTKNDSNFRTVNTAVLELLNANQKVPEIPKSLAPHLPAIGTIFTLFDSGLPVTIEDILRKLTDYGKTSAFNKDWADKQTERLLKMSPMSLRITLKQLQNGSKLSFAENFKMEYWMSQHCAHSHDFSEGVRAILIDKDNNPKWNPDTLAEATPAMVDTYFTSVPGIAEWCP